MDLTFIMPYIPLLSGLVAGIITYLIIPSIIRVSYQRHLCDDPSRSHRKLHLHVTPTLGGVAIFAAVLFTFMVSSYAVQPWVPSMAAGLLILFFSGIKDDIYTISPLKKLILQITAVVLIIAPDNTVITNLGGVFGVHQIPYWVGFVLTTFTMIVVLNAYNLIDGVDGLAGGIGIIACSFFGWWFWQAGMMAHAVLAIVLAGSLFGFMWYNFSPAKIFMGDTGSQIVGYLLAFFAVSFVTQSTITAANTPFKQIAPVLVLSILIVPLYDTLRVFIVRVFNGQSPFEPDRRHIHHQLLDVGFNHKGTCFVIYGFNLTVIGLTMLLPTMNINILFAIILLTAVFLFPTFSLKRSVLKRFGVIVSNKNLLKKEEDDSQDSDKKPRRVAI